MGATEMLKKMSEQMAEHFGNSLEDRDFSSYVTDVSATSAGPFHLFSDVDLRTASLLIPKSFTSGGSLIVFSVTSLDQP